MNVKKLTIHFYETGKTVPDANFLLKIRREFLINIDSLFFDENVDTFESHLGPISYTIELLNSINEAGIRRVYERRSVALDKFLPHIAKETDKVIIIGSSLLGLRTASTRVVQTLEDKVQRSEFELRVLLTHPKYSAYRESQEGRAKGAIEREIKETVTWLQKVVGVKDNNIKLYKGTPTVFLIITSQRMLLNPYPYQTEAFKSYCLEVERTSEDHNIYTQYHRHHYERAWENQEMTVTWNKYLEETENQNNTSTISLGSKG